MRFHQDSPGYFFSNENLSSAFRHLNISGKRVLSVAGSGDPVLEAAACSAEAVHAIDISRNAIAHTNLKIAAIQKLPYHEYLRFFAENAFDYETYQTLRDKLPQDIQEWYDQAYEKHSFVGHRIPRNHTLFNKTSLKTANNLQHLVDEESYERAKEGIRRIPVQVSQGDLLSQEASGFDIIYLSNIADYLQQFLQDPAEFRYIVEKYMEALNPGGTLCANYIRRAENEFFLNNGPEIKNEAFRRRVLSIPGTFMEELMIRGYFQDSQDMLVLVHKTS